MDILNAIVEGDPARLAEAIAAGSNPNVCDGDGVPATLHVADTGRVDLMKPLVEGGADLEATDGIGWTALMAAIAAGAEDLVTFLLAHGANANHVGREDTPLTAAVAEASISMVGLLLEHGANADLRRQDGWTPLMLAAFSGDVPRLQLLLEHGADASVTMGPRLMDAATVAAAHHHTQAHGLLLDAARSSQPSLRDLWKAVLEWCEKHAPPLSERFESTVGLEELPESWITLPADAKQQLTNWAPRLPIYDYVSLAANDAHAIAETMRQRAEAGEFVGKPTTALGEDEPVLRVYWAETWVPLARDPEGNMLLADLSPEASGVLGQLVSWSVEQGPLAVLASGFTPYLQQMTVQLARGSLRFDRRTSTLTLAPQS